MTTLLAAGATQTQFLIAQVVAFVLLVAILGKLVAPALKKMLADRTKGIEDSFAKMEKETAETAMAATPRESPKERISPSRSARGRP